MKKLTTSQSYRRVISAIILACFLALAILASPLLSAHAAATAAGHENCQVVLDKLHPHERSSHVLSYQCAAADEALAAPMGTAGIGPAQLMTWHEDANFGGASTKIWGKWGACDADGYGISGLSSWASSFWNDRISSFETWNGCDHTSAFVDENYSGPCQNYFAYQVPYVGDIMNDRISSFWIANGRYHRCG